MPRKLERVAEEQLLQTLSSSIEEQSSTALYACGGAIGIDEGHQPITIRFDVGKPKGTARKVVFPTTSDTDVQELVKTCLPASFGRAGKDVFDESYRRAGKLDNLNFSTSFHPADFGIIDSIQQLLRPGIKGSELNPSTMVRAELYKLNVSSRLCVVMTTDAGRSTPVPLASSRLMSIPREVQTNLDPSLSAFPTRIRVVSLWSATRSERLFSTGATLLKLSPG